MKKADLLLDSITDAGGDAAGAVAVSGSHGGLYAAAVASRAGLRAVILNDAGRGRNAAGIAGVRALATVGMAACAVDCMSAEIGNAADMRNHGIVSFANSVAEALGVRIGDRVSDAMDRLAGAPKPTGRMEAVPEARWEESFGEGHVLCVDSASLIRPEDVGRLIVTGSHGGLIGGDPKRACKAAARLVSFSDAGVGKNGIGQSRLPALEGQGIAAVTLDCASCEIGSAASALKFGVLSAANAPARRLGVRVGMPLAEGLAAVGGSLDRPGAPS